MDRFKALGRARNKIRIPYLVYMGGCVYRGDVLVTQCPPEWDRLTDQLGVAWDTFHMFT
jgi:hypothetical protein